MSPDAGPVPPPASAAGVFGAALPLAVEYAELLASAGVERGLIGPREVPVLWPRHLVNSALVAERVPDGARVVDVGSGAGLPGIPLALARPDVSVDLVEPLARRVEFLTEVVQALGLAERVRVVHGRAEERRVRAEVAGADVATARAVAALDQLVRWCLPLVRPGGALVALKGRRAPDEVEQARPRLSRLGAGEPVLVEVGSGDETTTLVVVPRRR